LPLAIRTEVNQRLLAGEPASRIIAWLHTKEEVLRVLDDYFKEQPINPQNMTEWRQGGYRDWLDRRARTERVKELSEYAARVAAAGDGDLMQSSAALAGGQLLEILEDLDVEAQKKLLAEKPTTFLKLLGTLSNLQRSGADARRAAVSEEAARLAEEKLHLARAKFERQTCELFLRWFDKREAKAIAERGDLDRGEQIDQLRLVIFGENPHPA